MRVRVFPSGRISNLPPQALLALGLDSGHGREVELHLHEGSVVLGEPVGVAEVTIAQACAGCSKGLPGAAAYCEACTRDEAAAARDELLAEMERAPPPRLPANLQPLEGKADAVPSGKKRPLRYDFGQVQDFDLDSYTMAEDFEGRGFHAIFARRKEAPADSDLEICALVFPPDRFDADSAREALRTFTRAHGLRMPSFTPYPI